jgi:F-type H+-transporting ATPase subunit b
MKRTRNTAFIIVLAVLLINGIVFASGGEGEHGSNIMDWVWRFLNFAVLVALLVFLARKMGIKEYFKKRTELIEKSIKEATEAKEAAERALKEVEERLKLKDQEVEKIIEAAKKSGEDEREVLIQDGEKMSQKIKDQAKVNIEQELKDAKAQLKAEASLLAIELAEKKIKNKLTRDDQLKILEESLKKLEGKNE